MQERMVYTWQFQLLFSWKYGELVGISFKNPFTKVVTPFFLSPNGEISPAQRKP
jgi:hypothetical protein